MPKIVAHSVTSILCDELTRCVDFLRTQTMGTHFVLQKPYDMAKTYEETSPATPMFFVLFPGVDPTPWVENLARTLDITAENGTYLIIES